jgi:hypothetical protein
VLCLTATATPSVVVDICNEENGFAIDLEEGVFSTGAFRQKYVLALLLPFLPASSSSPTPRRILQSKNVRADSADS